MNFIKPGYTLGSKKTGTVIGKKTNIYFNSSGVSKS